MRSYQALLEDIILNGELLPTRAKVDGKPVAAYSVFGRQLRLDLRGGFPLLTTKKLSFKNIKVELLWFLRGDTNVAYLREHGCTIWDEWARPDGSLGPVYGHQWRKWGEETTEDENHDGDMETFVTRPGLDQVAALVQGLQGDPHSRRHIISAWNVADIPHMALAPCHCLVQFHVGLNNRLSCQVYQRSADVFLGIPYNIASYALLTHMLAHVTGLIPGELVHTMGNAHLYENHMAQARLQLERLPMQLPRLQLAPHIKDIFAFCPGDILIEGYAPHPAIHAKVAI